MAFHLTWEFTFGLLGNIISALVCLAPLPTFYLICKKKTSEGYQSIPYVIALFSAMLWLFYAIFQKGAMLLITINTLTFFMEIGYIFVYLLYATKKDRILTTKLVLLFNVFGFGLVCVFALFVTQGETRVQVLGWICMIFSLCVFVAPLGIVRKVIKTKSVEFMPIYLSIFLTLSAVMWFFYGYLKKDMFVAIPNILGLIFGILQMVLYMMYKNVKLQVEQKLQELPDVIHVDIDKLSAIISCSENAVLNIITHEELSDNVGNGGVGHDEKIVKEQTNKA